MKGTKPLFIVIKAIIFIISPCPLFFLHPFLKSTVSNFWNWIFNVWLQCLISNRTSPCAWRDIRFWIKGCHRTPLGAHVRSEVQPREETSDLKSDVRDVQFREKLKKIIANQDNRQRLRRFWTFWGWPSWWVKHFTILVGWHIPSG